MRVKLPEPVAAIYRAVQELEAAYPGRKFTPDGHLVGSIGEVVAARELGLNLGLICIPALTLDMTPSTPTVPFRSR
jgi:hypothetical protein